jgi:hypothetical protein
VQLMPAHICPSLCFTSVSKDNHSSESMYNSSWSAHLADHTPHPSRPCLAARPDQGSPHKSTHLTCARGALGIPCNLAVGSLCSLSAGDLYTPCSCVFDRGCVHKHSLLGSLHTVLVGQLQAAQCWVCCLLLYCNCPALFACVVGCTRLVEASEVTILQASGLCIYRPCNSGLLTAAAVAALGNDNA